MDYREDHKKFKDLLNKEYSWPARYTFKFIVPTNQKSAVGNLFKEEVEIIYKPSSAGKYVSITIYATMQNADEIIAIYETASTIKGIISL